MLVVDDRLLGSRSPWNMLKPCGFHHSKKWGCTGCNWPVLIQWRSNHGCHPPIDWKAKVPGVDVRSSALGRSEKQFGKRFLVITFCHMTCELWPWTMGSSQPTINHQRDHDLAKSGFSGRLAGGYVESPAPNMENAILRCSNLATTVPHPPTFCDFFLCWKCGNKPIINHPK